jgi:hypothetical protein
VSDDDEAALWRGHVSDEYERMGPGELLARLQDWMRVATDRATRIGELEAERDRLRAVVDAVRVASDAGSLVSVLAALYQFDGTVEATGG